MSSYINSLNGNQNTLSLSVSLFSVGRLVGAPFLGWWYNRRPALEPICFTLILGCLSNLMYSASSVSNYYVLLSSRFLVGFATGVLSVSRAHIAAQTTVKQRTRFMGYSGAIQFIGYGLMPGFASAFININTHILIPINSYTFPGIFLAAINIATIPICFFLFSRFAVIKQPQDEIDQLQKQPLLGSSTKSGQDEVETQSNQQQKSPEESEPQAQIEPEPQAQQAQFQPQSQSLKQRVQETSNWLIKRWTDRQVRFVIIGAAVFVLLNFVARGVIALLETLATPLFIRIWDPLNLDNPNAIDNAGKFYLVLGIGGLFSYLLVGNMRKVISDMGLLIIGFLCIAVGLLLIVVSSPSTMITFVLSTSLILCVGSPLVQTVTLSSFSKILGPRPQGVAMAVITSAGSVGRIIFPLFVTATGETGSFIFGIVLCLLSIVCAILYFIMAHW